MVVYVIAANHAEGRSPRSLRALAQRLVRKRVGALPMLNQGPRGE